MTGEIMLVQRQQRSFFIQLVKILKCFFTHGNIFAYEIKNKRDRILHEPK